MGSLSNQFISQSYISLIHLGNDNIITSSFTTLQDGLGNSLNVSVNAQGDISASGNIYATNLTGSTVSTASLVTTSSFNQYTSSTNARLDSLETTSGSLIVSTSNALYTASFSGNTITFTKGNGNTFGVVLPDVSGSDVSALNAFTASIAGTNAFTQSANARLNSLESTTSSLNNSVSSLNGFTASVAGTNAFTQSAASRLNSLESTSGSLITSASNSLYTASFDNGSRNLTFTKGSGGTFSVNIPDASGSILPSGTISGSAQISALGFVSSSVTASSLTTASISGQTITFTKGDASTFDIILPSGSVPTDITALNAFTASVAGTNAFTASIAGTNTFTASIAETNTFTASVAGTNTFTASIAGTNAFTASAQNSLNSLNAATSSYITSAVTASMAVSSSLYAVTASLARSVIVSAINDNPSTLPIGTVVRISGATGDNPRFNTASYDDETTSANTLGILANTAVSGDYADITVIGKLVGVNTDPALGYVAGDLIYLGANGGFTNVQPQAPLQIVVLGEVLRVQQNNGSIFVNISNGWELNELHNVRITSAAQGDLLVYEASSSLWKNQTSSSFAKTNEANTFNANQIVSGSMTVTGNLEVFGSASFVTVTSSVILGGNTIVLNTFTPSVRYGGVEVIDSGSTGLTGSLLWDSQNDVWLYVNPSGSSYVSAKFISGPKSLTLGSEPSLTQNRVPKADDGDHIVDSQISDDGTTVTITNAVSASTFVGLGNLSSYSASVDSRINNISSSIPSLTSLNEFTASVAGTNDFTASIAGTNAFTQSTNARLNSIEGVTGSYATTGSNVFKGQQTLTDANLTSQITLGQHSGSLVLFGAGFTSSSMDHVSASSVGLDNIIFKANNNTGTTIVSGSSNLFTNANIPTATFVRYFGGSGNIALNASNVPQISSSIAFPITMNNNYFGGNNQTITARGPVSSSAWTISANNILGAVTIGSVSNADKIISGITMTGNVVNGQISLQPGVNNLSNSVNLTNNNINGTLNLSLGSSSVAMASNFISDTGFTINNNYFSSSVGIGQLAINRSNIGGQNNTYTIQGVIPVGGTGTPSLSDNTIHGGSNTLFVDVANAALTGSAPYFSAVRNTIAGNNLIVSGSSSLTHLQTVGSAFFGRYNSQDGNKSKTAQTVFAVGTGNTTTRKTGFLIDSGSNTFIEGTLNVSGATSLNGDLTVTGSFTASLQNGYAWVGDSTGKSVPVPTSSFAGGATDISALNAFTASIAGTNAFTASTITSLNSINGFTASALVTASFSGNTLTFTKGDASTFGIILPDVSGSGAINTGSFATTGSNSFFGNQTISGSVGISGSAITFVSGTLSGSVVTNIGDIYTDVNPVNRIITLTSASYAALASGSLTDPNALYIVSGSTGVVDLGPLNTFTASIAGTNAFTASIAGTNAFTASAQLEINALEGFSASTITRLNSIEAKTGSFATTGSNSFIGNQTISGSSVYTGSVQGNVVSMSIASNTASMDFNAGNFFTITLASGSIPTFINPTNIKAGQTVSLVVTQASTLSGSLAFPTTFKFASGSAYVPSAVTSSKDIVTFITVDTTTIFASSVKNLI